MHWRWQDDVPHPVSCFIYLPVSSDEAKYKFNLGGLDPTIPRYFDALEQVLNTAA